LKKEESKFQGVDYSFHDELLLYNNGLSIETSLSGLQDDYEDKTYMELEEGRLRYYYVFEDNINLTQITVANPLEIEFLDNLLTITDIQSATSMATQSATKYDLEIGESIEVGNLTITLLNVDEEDQILLGVGEASFIIPQGITKIVDTIKIKNQETFHIAGGKCCCLDIFSILKSE